MRALTEVLEDPKCVLVNLNLKRNPIGDKGLVFLAGSLAASKLQSLNVGETGVGYKGLHALANVVKHKASLIQLILAGYVA